MSPFVKNEFDTLKYVILGIADSLGGVPVDPYDPKSKEHVAAGTFPKENDLKKEISSFADLLVKYEVNVFRPEVITDYNQIFTRDIAFVIEDKFIISNMITDRDKEYQAIVGILDELGIVDRFLAEPGVRFEGGDIVPHNDAIFIGYEEDEDFNKYRVSRTNSKGVNFIKNLFPEKSVYSFELKKSDTVAKENALHLDCCFQPLGLGDCLIYKGGFKNEKDYLLLKELIGEENCIDITQQEMYDMGSNVFSIRKDVVVSNVGQVRINDELRGRGYTVEEIEYTETAKMEGLFRCSTLPLLRG